MELQYTALRQYIKDLDITLHHVLKSCDLVIDADSYFMDTYRSSGCQFILGPDCDRYATFISHKLKTFLDSNIKCYVIFKGATKRDQEKRKEIHQRAIDHRNNIERNLDNPEYFQPLFVVDIQKQVLENLDIKYFVCDYDSIDAIVGVAKKFKCPVLTSNIEYSLFGVSCISKNSLEYNKNTQEIKCKIYNQEEVKTAFGVYGKTPLLLTLLNETGDYLDDFNENIRYRDSDNIYPVIRWVKSQRERDLVSGVLRIIGNTTKNKSFTEVYERIQTLFLYSSCNLAVKYFQRARPYGLFRDDKKWFEKGVCNGRIISLYVNLKNEGFVCGSLQMYDWNRPDAVIAAIDIIAYSHCLLTNSQDSTIKLLERKRDTSSIRKIYTHWDEKISNRHIFTEHPGQKFKCTGETDLFQIFLEEVLPGYDFNQPPPPVPNDCWILIIALVYYIHKKNKDFINGAYCVLLSYSMLGPVSEKIKAGFLLSSDREQNGLKFLFNRVDMKRNYNSSMVHDLSEFLHCLQHMNYLNKLCGEKIPCTIYCDTYNATFIYNTFMFMKDKDHLMRFLESNLGSNSLKMYKNIVTGFETCLNSVL